ncbi:MULTISPECIES: alpha/beta hydrolase [Aminobacter]|uniref:Membrane protein n=1 Tax=Aminobacter ciceronei TaxID=150723 RepID=A0ABR6C3H0_9HYPH|nr:MULTISPECIES: alpha/beta-hydrolase family protein [Aminobacter]MBA8905687.1 putative membrane protein [Aminobacter ciceronei]MBA9019466.1 putative membrane protein [Aminobacter ciceronei]BBD39931.1 membrane protein [Aminobacter sp. SS-2016]
MLRNWAVRYWFSFSTTGLLLGTLFFAASLTPTLIPRNYLTQGVLSGLSAAVGYGCGFFLRWLWRYLELPELRARILIAGKLIAAIACGIVGLAFLWQASEWQNSIRRLMQLAPVDTAHPLEVGAIALVTFVVLVAFGRLFKRTLVFVSEKLRRFVPTRVSYVIGTTIAVFLFWSAADGIIFRYGLRVMDSSFQRLDELMPAETRQPAEPGKTGSAASLVRWQDLGRMGRSYIASGPTAADIGQLTGKPAKEPIRVYVGLQSGDTPQQRAKLALEELKRAGGFERSTLVIVTPTGTGWVDEQAIDPIEFLHNGDVASVSAQYSYLASWLSLLVEPGYGAEQSRALFSEIYGYWHTLPRDTRPKLYLFGLSLGALSTELSNELFEVLGDPYQGALLSGPPFASRIWHSITDDRNPGSPEWLPEFRDGSYVRFTAQKNALDIPGAQWGPLRLVYLQYASDPITFYETHALYSEPDWMKTPRGPDVSPELRWYPVVTFLQLTLDLAMATTAPMGYGHVYAAEHYIDAWMQVADIKDVSPDEIARLKQHFADKRK